GKIEFRDMIAGVTIKRDVDEATGLMGTVIIEHKEDLHPQIVIVGEKKEVLASYSIPAGAHVIVEEGQKIRAGALLAKTPRKVAKTKDITGGLPRVAELFEARRPKDAAEIAKIDGVVEMGGTVRGKRSLILKDPETNAEEEHLIPLTKHIIVFKGDFVKKGQQMTEGRSCRMKFWKCAGRRIYRNTWSTKCRKFTGCKAWRLTTSTSRSSCARCYARSKLPIRATPLCSGATRSTSWSSRLRTNGWSNRAANRRKPCRCYLESPRPRSKPIASSRRRPSRTQPAF